MKLIGIKIDQDNTSESVKKNLKEEWYPFIDIYNIELNITTNDELKEKFQSKLDGNKDSVVNKLYSSTDEGQPDIFVHAIAGMNGSGKSSILEIFYRIINNLAYNTIGNEEREGSAPLLCASDLSATLFYEINEKVHYLECKWNKDNNDCVVTIDGQLAVKNNLNKFFYSIAVNYSHYSLNTDEINNYIETYIPPYFIFRKDLMSIREGKAEANTIRYHWLNGLFHKNDGYTTPIVISPMRTQGNFDINEENKLSKQRLIGLFILYEINKDKFLVEYNPLQIVYTLNTYSINDKIGYYTKIWNDSGADFKPLLYRIMIIWDKVLAEKYDIKQIIENKGLPSITNGLEVSHQYLTKLLFEYIACKTISISTKYNNFKSILSIEPNKTILDEDLEVLISEIIQKQSHITLKINQCIQYLKKVKEKKCYIDDTKKDVGIDHVIKEGINDFIGKNDFNKKSKVTVDDVFKVMLPPIFDIDIELQPNNAEALKSDLRLVKLSSMSSGERQMLYSMSSVLYHLRNIHSVDGIDRIKYKHVSIILDEVEMYYHPEYQREYINKLLKLITGLKLDKKQIESINICVVTHSPFILSDILKQNILFLKKGEVKNEEVEMETFGANFYDILRSGFFLKENALGQFVNEKIKSIIEIIEKKSPTKEELEKGYHSVDLIGDPFLKGYLLDKIEHHVQD